MINGIIDVYYYTLKETEFERCKIYIYIYIRSNRVIEAKLEGNLYTETFIEGTVGRIETPKLWLLKRAASLGTRLKSATVLQYVRTTFTCISFSRVAETLVACI